MNNIEKIALLIDADNTSPKYIEKIIGELTSKGTVVIRKAYGDWSTETLKSYKEILNQFAIIPIQQFAYTKGKNSTDGAMIIDAMDILYTKNIDCFCIATSDCDFTRLANRIREEGKTVIGMGRQQTVPAFINACSEFKCIDVLFDENTELDESMDDDIAAENSNITSLDDISSSISKYILDNDGKANLSGLKSFLKGKFPDFDERNYGYSKFSTFLESLNQFKLEKSGTYSYISLLNDDSRDIEKISQYFKKQMNSGKKKHYTSGEIQNLIAKEFNNFKLKNLGFSTMKSFLKSLPFIKADDNKKYYYEEK